MNKNKIAILALIVGFVSIAAYFLGQQFLGNKTLKPVEVESAQAISTDIVEPQASIFNDLAINPTVKITIGENDQTPLGN